MKILNWVHRKLHLNTNYSQVSSQKKDVYVGDEGKTASPKKALEQDTEALLLQDVLNGILTIGTLGHSHAFLADQTDSTAGEEEPALEEVEEEEEVVMHAEEKEATDQHVAVGAVSGAGAGQHPLRVVELSTIRLPISLEEKCVAVAVPETEEILELPLLMEDKEKLERRTTLADLFAAEAINESAAAADKISSANYVRINSSSEQQQGAADQKKLMKQRKKYKGEQKPSTSKKFQKLITRMLKKKIHPAEMAAPPVAAGKDRATKEISYADQKPRHGPVRAT